MQGPESSFVEAMEAALRQAEQALAVDEVPVGCVILDASGAIIGAGHNETNQTRDPTMHAELVALRRMRKEGISVKRAHTLVVTIEPCIMCAAALRQLDDGHVLHRVVFGARNSRFGGCGTVENVLMNPEFSSGSCPTIGASPTELHEGVLADQAVLVLKRFYASENTRWAPEEKRRRKEIDLDVLD